MHGISVITTLFNYTHYVEDCIKSFLRQEDPGVPIEHIIVDDCSTDNPKKVLDKYNNKNIRCFYLDHNSGYSAAKNYGIKKSKYDVIVMIDADDWLTNDSLKIRYGKLTSKKLDFVHGGAYMIKGGKNAGVSPQMKMWRQEKKSNRRWRHIHAQGVMLKKKIHSEVGLYDETMTCKSDREMWARIFNRGYRIGSVKKPVAFYRCHGRQMHRSKWKAKNNKKLTADMEVKIKRRAKDLGDVEML